MFIFFSGSPSEPEHQATRVSGAFGGKRRGRFPGTNGRHNTGEQADREGAKKRVDQSTATNKSSR